MKLNLVLLLSLVAFTAGSLRAQDGSQAVVLGYVLGGSSSSDGVDFASISSLATAVDALNMGRPNGAINYSIAVFGDLIEADTFASMHPDQQVNIIIHGVFDRTSGEFTGYVTDATRETYPVSFLNSTAFNPLNVFYCGMHGDNLTINTLEITETMLYRNGGTIDTELVSVVENGFHYTIDDVPSSLLINDATWHSMFDVTDDIYIDEEYFAGSGTDGGGTSDYWDAWDASHS